MKLFSKWISGVFFVSVVGLLMAAINFPARYILGVRAAANDRVAEQARNCERCDA